MFEQLMNKLAEMLAVRMEANRKADVWSMTVECWQCKKQVPQSHLLCGYCGATLHSPRRQLTPQQEQVAELETQQVTVIPARSTRVDPERYPRLYRYRAYGQLTDAPRRLSPHQTRQLVKKYAE